MPFSSGLALRIVGIDECDDRRIRRGFEFGLGGEDRVASSQLRSAIKRAAMVATDQVMRLPRVTKPNHDPRSRSRIDGKRSRQAIHWHAPPMRVLAAMVSIGCSPTMSLSLSGLITTRLAAGGRARE